MLENFPFNYGALIPVAPALYSVLFPPVSAGSPGELDGPGMGGPVGVIPILLR